MKNRILLFFDYLRQLMTNEYPDSKSDVKKRKVSTEDNLRWQDDGGPVIDNTKPILSVAIDKAAQPTDISEKE